MKYKYTPVPGETDICGRITRRPIVEIELSNGKHARVFSALLDSGADQITMPAYIAELFGIERGRALVRPMLGISMKPIHGFVGELTIRIERQTERFAALVVFVDSEMPIVLGREGFFDRYRIKFEQDHNTFEISPVLK